MDRRLIRISKYLSRHLRHAPRDLGLVLEPGGWVPVDDLLTACAAHGFPISPDELDQVVAQNDKQRFSFDTDRRRIRANQGHSIPVDLQLQAIPPPEVLYHGTSHRTAGAIEREGLQKMARHHVHLSADIPTALAVGRRYGKPVVFAVDAARLHAAGMPFYRSENGVWLVASVPPNYLTRLREPEK